MMKQCEEAKGVESFLAQRNGFAGVAPLKLKDCWDISHLSRSHLTPS